MCCARKQFFTGELGKWNGLQSRIPGVRYLPPVLGALPGISGWALFFDIYTVEQTFLDTRAPPCPVRGGPRVRVRPPRRHRGGRTQFHGGDGAAEPQPAVNRTPFAGTGGSTPSSTTSFSTPVAQRTEQRLPKPRRAGSNPAGGSGTTGSRRGSFCGRGELGGHDGLPNRRRGFDALRPLLFFCSALV
jgi:hypothetical protein